MAVTILSAIRAFRAAVKDVDTVYVRQTRPGFIGIADGEFRDEQPVDMALTILEAVAANYAAQRRGVRFLFAVRQPALLPLFETLRSAPGATCEWAQMDRQAAA